MTACMRVCMGAVRWGTVRCSAMRRGVILSGEAGWGRLGRGRACVHASMCAVNMHIPHN